MRSFREMSLPAVLPGGLLFSLLLVTAWGCASGVPPKEGAKCGNGVLETGEVCDGSELGDATCESLGYGAGTLSCGAHCIHDTTGCGSPDCGNFVIDEGEECDGYNLGGASCVSLGFDGGPLTCTAGCKRDTSGCVNIGCGNGLIEAGEQCDDGNTTAGDGCGANCLIELGWACSGQPSVCSETCGNGVIDPGEDCDSGLLGGSTCASLGFTGGDLACDVTCRYDITGCEGSLCGNGALDEGEECDGSLFGEETCVSKGFAAGNLACTAGCTIDTSGCTNSICGNSVREAGEECDGAQLGGANCATLGYDSGILSCSGSCTYDTSGCVAASDCGNGVIDPGEDCDDGNTVGGDGCSSSCRYETICSANATIGCGETVSRSEMLTASNQVEGYSCGNNTGDTADRIYSFVAPATGVATLFLDVEVTGLFGDDLDLYVMEGSCHPGNCVGASETSGDDSLIFNVTTGKTYFVVAELYRLMFPVTYGAYTLTLTCP